MFKCKYCNQEFETKHKLSGHVTHCKLNPNYERNKINCDNITKTISQRTLTIITNECPYCKENITSTKSGVTFHINHCKENPNRKIHPGNYGHTIGHKAWNKGLTAKDDIRIEQGAKTRKENYKKGLWQTNSHKWTTEEKEQIRLNTIKYIETLKGPYKCRYSKKGCEYINKLNEEKHWNLQHAENGGEFEIAGYYLDGYDKELNIAFEYDEPGHYEDVVNNILNKKDIERQNYIIDKLHCEFWRYNEKTNTLYKVN